MAIPFDFKPPHLYNKLALLTTNDEGESDGPDVIQTEQ